MVRDSPEANGSGRTAVNVTFARGWDVGEGATVTAGCVGAVGMLGSCNRDVVQANPLNSKTQMENDRMNLFFDFISRFLMHDQNLLPDFVLMFC
jgi:hypothetical protein